MAYTPTLWAKGDVVTSEKLNKIEQGIVDKVDKVDGKGLSTNDYTDQDKAKLDGLESQIDHLESLVGSPLVASTAAEMTNEDKVYVYTGNETGYQNGYWYYYDGTAWTQGGVYNSVAINVDDTLSISGVPADAKKTGDEIGDLKSGLNDISKQFVTIAHPELVNGTISTGNGLDITGNTKVVRVKSPTPIGDFTKFVLVDPTTYNLNIYLYTGTSQYSFTRCFEGVSEWDVSQASPTELYVRYQVDEKIRTNDLDPSVDYVISYGPIMDVSGEIDKKIDKSQGTENVGKVLAVSASGLVEPSVIQIDVDPTLSEQGGAADAKATGDRISAVELSGLNAVDNINFVIGNISPNIGVMDHDSTSTNTCSSGYYKVSDYAGVVLNADISLYRLDLYFYTSTRWQDFVKANNQIDVSRYMFTDSEKELYFRVQIRSRNSTAVSTSIRYVDLLTERNSVTVSQRNADKRNSIVAAKGKNQDNFSLLVITDIHGDEVRMLNAIDFLNKCDKIDAGACLGDISANHYATSCDFYPNAVLNAKKPFLTVIGNHDAGNGKPVSSNGTQQQIFDKFIAPVVEKAGVETTKSYYYKDFSGKNVRVIVLNSSDMPDTLESDTAFLVSHGTLGAFSQAQIDWFISTLANTPTGYHVLVLMHYVNAPMRSDSDVNFQSSSGGYSAGTENNAYSGIIQDIVSAWVSGGTLTQNYTSSIANMPTVNVSADFTSRGTGVFIGVLSGHRHRDIIGKFDNYPNQWACVFSLANQPRGSEDDLARIAGEKSEDLLTVVSVDTTNRRLYLVRIGANLSTLFKYREDSCIEY